MRLSFFFYSIYFVFVLSFFSLFFTPFLSPPGLISSVGKYFSQPGIDIELVKKFSPLQCKVSIGGVTIFNQGQFDLSLEKEVMITKHMKDAELYSSRPMMEGEKVVYENMMNFPSHKRCVEIDIDLGMDGEDDDGGGDGGGGGGLVTVLGSSLTHEYVAENADYRS